MTKGSRNSHLRLAKSLTKSSIKKSAEPVSWVFNLCLVLVIGPSYDEITVFLSYSCMFTCKITIQMGQEETQGDKMMIYYAIIQVRLGRCAEDRRGKYPDLLPMPTLLIIG